MTVLDIVGRFVELLVAAARYDADTETLTKAVWRDRAGLAVERDARPAVLLVDLDEFKQLNDRHGHLAGDQALIGAAHAIRSEIRHVDLIGRVGGDEFGLLLSGNVSDSAAVSVGHRIRARIADLQIRLLTPQGSALLSGLTVSVGVTAPAGDCSIGSRPSLSTLVWHADAAMYDAKRAGGDAVRLRVTPAGAAAVSAVVV